MKKQLPIILFMLFFLNVASGRAEESSLKENSSWVRLNDIYFESIRLSNVDTVAGYVQVRSGLSSALRQVEAYAVVRSSMDTRTLWGSSLGVYNDNFFFGGGGVDYLGLLPGLRLTAQVGASLDLSNKIHQGGFDYRFGTQSYHEIPWNRFSLGALRTEIYSEALYFCRYGNLLADLQLRTYYNLGNWRVGSAVLAAGPIVNWVTSVDSAGLDYNRFMEVRFGARVSLNGPIALSFSPYYVLGGRWSRPTSLPSYGDFRVLLSGSAAL